MSVVDAPELEQHSLPRSILLHMLPGFALFGFIHLAGPLAQRHGASLALATSLGILLVLVPLELGMLISEKRRRQLTWAGLLGVQRPIRPAIALPLVGLLLVWMLGISGLWRSALSDLVQGSATLARLESLMPAEQELPLSGAGLWAVIGLRVVCSGIVAPVVEELYFRGYLLPRISRLGGWAAVLNTFLFAAHHLWTPLLIPGRTLAWLPTIYLVLRRRNLAISIAVHLIANLVGVVIPALTLLQQG